MIELQQKVGRAIDRARFIWAFCSGVALVLTLIYLPWYAVLGWAILAYISYFGTLILTAWLLAATISPEEIDKANLELKEHELRERVAAGAHTPEDAVQMMRDAGIVDVVEVQEIGPEIGKYKGNPIYEYVMMKSPNSEELQKFLYHGPANIVDGMPDIPVTDGMVFAHIEGLLYFIYTEPENEVVQNDNPSI